MTKVDIQGITKTIPDEVKDRVVELIGERKVEFVGLVIEDGKWVRVELKVPLVEIAEELAASLEKFSKRRGR